MDKKEIINRINGTKIGLMSGPAYLLLITSPFRGFMRMKKYYKEYYNNMFVALNNVILGQYFDEEQNMRNVKQLYEKPDETKRLMKSWREEEEKFFKYCNDILNNLDKIKDNKLAERFEEFMNEFYEIWAAPLAVDGMASYTETELLDEFNSALNGVDKDNAHEYFAQLSHPAQVSFVGREHVALLNLVLLYKQGQNIKEALQEHQKTFFWVENNYKNVKILDKKYFFDKIKTESKKSEGEIRKEIDKIIDVDWIEENREKLLKKLKLNNNLKEKMRMTPILGEWLDNRKEINLRGNHVLNEFVKEVAKRKKIKVEDIYYFTPEDVLNLIRNGIGVSKQELNNRKKAIAFIITDSDKESLFSGEDAKEIGKALEKRYNECNKTEEIKGIVASRGNLGSIKGKARIVLDPSKDDFKNGEILVASMTRPEYVPLMKKALAIVTDEGGITSHAAIVSRELNVPCVIGTRNATRTIKSGDEIEIDLEKGVVRVVK